MATVIRFARHGTKKKPYYRIVVQNQTAPRDGKFIEHIGSFDPLKGDEAIQVERARLEYWLGTGAQMSDSVKNRVKGLRKQWESATVETVASTAAPKPAAKRASSKEA